MTRRREDEAISRRVFLTRAGGITIALGTSGLWLPRAAFGREPYEGGVWLAGDHHIHTKYSPDGQYEIERQIASAVKFGLGWCVITDHGGPFHDKIALETAYPELVAARKRHADIHIFQGMEWNIPAAEHGSVILPPTPDEAKRVAEFESLYDELNKSKRHTPANTEADAVAGVKYLQSLTPKPIFIANHPARRGRDSPVEMRNWADAGPDVARGFEGAPGHQAATFVAFPRGHYEKSPKPDSWPDYPLASYRTWGGYDWYVTQIGGLWDSLLGEGRPWYITANSDSHRHWTDHTKVDEKTYLTKGYVTPTSEQLKKAENIDFWPGEYTKTWVYAARSEPMAILDALRGGSMFTAHGGLIDRLELTARSADAAAPMGGTLRVDKAGDDVTVRVRIRPASRPNGGGIAAKLHHIDLIAGDILGPAAARSAMTNPTTKIVAQPAAAELTRDGDWLAFAHRFTSVRKSFYIRLRGTNRDLAAPQQDTLTVNPWEDLWFYSNPVMIRV